MGNCQLLDELISVVGNEALRCQEPMKRHTTFAIGGPADYFLEPATTDQIVEVFRICDLRNVPVTVIGKGSNLLVSDHGIRGVVMKMGPRMSELSVQGDQIRVQAGATLGTLAEASMEQALSGVEFTHGIPGTVGGALVMNAGAFGGEMKDVLVSCEVVTARRACITLDLDQMEMGYRTSRMQKNGEVIVEACFRLTPDHRNDIQKRMRENLGRRHQRQPYDVPSGGSVFKRPEGYFAGQLIEDCHLKGLRRGGAMVSERHAGFIVNIGQATAEDVQVLIAMIQERVKERTGVCLEPELRIIGP